MEANGADRVRDAPLAQTKSFKLSLSILVVFSGSCGCMEI